MSYRDYRVLRHESGDLPIIFPRDPKIVIHGNESIILLIARYIMS